MKRTILNILIVCFVSMLFSGCNFFHSSYTVSMSNSYKDLEIGTYAILPFKDQRNGRVKKKTPDAANVMSDSFETAFLDTGFRVVERSKVNKVLKEMKFSHQGYVDDTQLKKIGKLTNSDAIIVGLVRVFQGPEFKNPEDHEDATKCSSISFSVKAIHVETGEILWKGSISKSTGFSDDVLYGCEYEVYRYADKIAENLMEEIMKKIKPKEKNPPKKKQTDESEE